MRALCFFFLSFLFFSCGHDSSIRTGKSPDAGKKISATAALEQSGIDVNFYKRLSGTIAGKPVVVHLQCWNGVIQGSYQYTGIGQAIGLRSSSGETKDREILLDEDVPGADDAISGSWKVAFNGAQLSGIWTNSDGNTHYPIELHEDYPAGTTKFRAVYSEDSASLLPGEKSPTAVVTYSYLLPEQDNIFLSAVLRQQIAPHRSSETDIGSAIHIENEAYFADYRKVNSAIFKNMSDKEEAFSFNYTQDEILSVLYNDDNWVITECLDASYTGGAHGNYGAAYTNIDLAQNRIWNVTDVITDTAALRPMLNDAAISYFKLQPGQGMDNRILVDEVPPTGNFYISGQGISFVYNPYEIASYADGQVTLFVPYSKLNSFLTGAFKARMKISENKGLAAL